ncbi:hypothetical protein BBF96_05515 [Anoxybacter fermentans]|uniref:DUF4367 domain-containing protein n=1 Tax=Anoxybacter fermentans TaxID=1323375 RepID=A0A3Q9HPU4_9FIRM|nr:hypothetical protein [Anoxybacter fermentans]AZR72895.1 hypothetical protein BBF96_05515 [Anoxybacter fermentans]
MIFKNGFKWVVIVLIIISVIYVITNKFNFPIPNDIHALQDFVSGYSITSNITNKFMEDFHLDDTKELYAATIGSGNKQVLFAAIHFQKTTSAGLFFLKYKNFSMGNIKTGSLDINIPLFFNYWTAKTGGRKYISWRKGEWVIIISGKNSKRVNEIFEDFKSFVK